MNGLPTPKNSVGNALKIYFFPSLVTMLAMLIWRDVSELRSDVKALLAQSNVDKTEIQNLRRDVDMLNRQIFKMPATVAQTNVPIDKNTNLYLDRYFKHEEVFDINKHLADNN